MRMPSPHRTEEKADAKSKTIGFRTRTNGKTKYEKVQLQPITASALAKRCLEEKRELHDGLKHIHNITL
jgi:hypothetical protein